MKATDKIGIYNDEFPRRDGTIEMWFNMIGVKKGFVIVRPFRVQKVLNNNLHLN